MVVMILVMQENQQTCYKAKSAEFPKDIDALKFLHSNSLEFWD